MAKETYQRLKSTLVSGSPALITKERILECYALPILLYRSECWTVSSQMTKKLEAVELWFYRRILKVSWTSDQGRNTKKNGYNKDNNKDSKATTDENFGHLMRKDGMESLSIMGRIDGKRSRGRQRITYVKT